MKENLQNALDDVVSSRSSSTRRSRGLKTIEELLANSCSPQTNLTLGCFMSLQDDFECNVPSRLLPWILGTTKDLEEIVASPQKDEEQIQTLSSQLSESLTIMQGVALNHDPTKIFLGRKYPLELYAKHGRSAVVHIGVNGIRHTSVHSCRLPLSPESV